VSGLLRYALQRLLLTIPMIFVLLTVIFLVIRVIPGDPISMVYGGRPVSEELKAAKRAELGFDKPILVQYGIYISGVFRGDFGVSLRTSTPVLQELFSRFPATIELALFGLIVAAILGFSTGVLAATRADHPTDHAVRIFHIASFAVPVFWLGLMFQVFFSVKLGWLPVTGRLGGQMAFSFEPITGFYVIDAILHWDGKALIDVLRHLALPALTLGIATTGLLGRMSRASMLEVLDQDYVTTARAKGLPERTVVLRHALRNALIPIVTVFGLELAVLMGGAVLTEHVFSWPGIASYLIRSINARDYTAIQGSVVFIALFISAINLFVDLLYSIIDPRVRY
jgi:ABC-type dipeptide/oligopeptide/nickel transport system permease component